MSRRSSAIAAVLVAASAAGCGAATHPGAGTHPGTGRSALAIDLARTRPLGAGPRFRPPAVGSPAVLAAAPVGSLRCARRAGSSYGAHIELFALDRGIAVPAGIGIAPPQRRVGAIVTGGRCAYPLRTVDPTGVVEVAPSAHVPTVGELFELWGQPLSPNRLGGIISRSGEGVVAFVNGRRWHGDPRSIPLSRHAQIVIELGAFVEPHPAYTFPPSL